LLIAGTDHGDRFVEGAVQVTNAISDPTDSISVSQLEEFFGDLSEYLLIPHYAKKPAIEPDTLVELGGHVVAGEVDSQKKFIRAIRDSARLCSVLFSDIRIHADLIRWPTRQTFIDCGDPTFAAIKACLSDKNKLALSENDGNKLFPVLPDGLMISTGLNVLLGKRSSGKSYTLNEIDQCNDNVKYIKQFALVQHDESDDERDFTRDVERRRRANADEFLSGFKTVLDDVVNIDREGNHRRVEAYVETLLSSAREADRQDSFSKAGLLNETAFPISSDESLQSLIRSVRQLIENIDYRPLIEKHLERTALLSLACELIEELRTRAFQNRKSQVVNELVAEVKDALKIRSAAIQLKDVDLYAVALDARKVARLDEIVIGLKTPAVLSQESVQWFHVVTEKGLFSGAGELKDASGVQTAFREAFLMYDRPFEYLQKLKQNQQLSSADFYRLFGKITFKIVNKHGFEVSGGERSEFRLLQEIKDAQNYDMLLIDEPESFFDNVFLNENVNDLLRAIARSMPVVVVTHSSTVGATIGADYLIHASRTVEDGTVSYGLYTGHPTDKKLLSTDGSTIATHELLMDSLEAGVTAYEERRKSYEAVED